MPKNFDIATKRQLRIINKKIDGLAAEYLSGKKYRAHKKAAKLFVSKVVPATPVRRSPSIKRRYDSKGGVIATYTPGNLRRSWGFDQFGDSGNVYIGAGNENGVFIGHFNGARADGYYLHMVEGGFTTRNGRKIPGQKFVERTYNSVKDQMVSSVTAEYKKYLEAYLQRQITSN